MEILTTLGKDYMSEKITKLQALVTSVLPLLEANLCSAHREWMEGKIARGAYEYCLQRNSVAIAITGRSAAELDVEGAFQAGATLVIDLGGAVADLPLGQRETAQAKVDELRSFFVEQGFTAVHPWLKIPVRPALEDAPEPLAA